MIDKTKFCDKYGFDPSALDQGPIVWAELEKIAADHTKRIAELAIAAKSVVGHLEKCKAVHSLRWRVKDTEHLLEKILRKSKAEPEYKITLEDYRSEITDLVGIRALHLFKSDWKAIHDEISKTWNLVDKHLPIAYIREGDERKPYEECGCTVEIHKRDYRSVHYDIQFLPTKELTIAEIQVRTLFEEGWSEIDHRIAYPHNADDPLLSGYLRIFNLLAGASDQMATYIGHLKRELDKLKADAQLKDKEAKTAITSLEQLQKQLGAATKEKAQLEAAVDALKRSTANSATTIGTLGNIFGTTSTASGSTVVFNPVVGQTNIWRKSCMFCGKPPPPTPALTIYTKCPHCGMPY